ncbi:MAG TPA: M1 family metallopeptidase [Gemmatimonadota bacterium]|nr:M1 family metallopeptidase [Gemmatimonadota bacterium]
MLRRSILSLAALVLAVASLAGTAHAQRPAGGVDARFGEPDLPDANPYRTGAGAPGPAYWQQRADYAIQASLDPATHTLRGSETITYTNGSPDTLTFVWVQLDQNLFAPGSHGAQTFPTESRFGGGGFVGGTTVQRVAGPAGELVHRIHDTHMRVELASPLAPGATTTIEIDWSFVVPENGADRMGRDGDHYVIAQWYPRMAVYDDLEGWNLLPYLGQGEFYLEFGDFEVDLTVPAAYLVGATGELANPEEVLTAEQIARIERARETGDIVTVVSAEELRDPAGYRPSTSGTATWRFRAESVRDFAWAAGARIVWDATSWEDVLIHALYRPEAGTWREAAEMTRHSIEFYSELLVDYPWPAATAVEGPVYGMEYPAIVFVAPETEREGLFDVLDHEWGHMWFPMMVGSNERRHAWMDEGIDSFVNQLSKQVFFPQSDPYLVNVAQYVQAVRAFPEQPMATLPDHFASDLALGVAAYIKPAVMLNALRALAGPEAFDAALRAYVRTWAWKHPGPADFFRLMEDELGMELETFWHGWIYTTATHDTAILGQDQRQAGDRWQVVVTVDQRGPLVMPARVVATTATGATDTVTIPAEAFYGTDRATATLTLPARAERITVNEGPAWGDVNPQNNVWQR